MIVEMGLQHCEGKGNKWLFLQEFGQLKVPNLNLLHLHSIQSTHYQFILFYAQIPKQDEQVNLTSNLLSSL